MRRNTIEIFNFLICLEVVVLIAYSTISNYFISFILLFVSILIINISIFIYKGSGYFKNIIYLILKIVLSIMGLFGNFLSIFNIFIRPMFLNITQMVLIIVLVLNILEILYINYKNSNYIIGSIIALFITFTVVISGINILLETPTEIKINDNIIITKTSGNLTEPNTYIINKYKILNSRIFVKKI